MRAGTPDVGNGNGNGNVNWSEGWTLASLAEHLASRIEMSEKHQADLAGERDTANKQMHVASKEAVTVALAGTKEALSLSTTNQEKALSTAMTASEKAIAKAETSAAAAASSEIRGALADLRKDFADRGQTSIQFDSISRRLDELKEGLTKRLDAQGSAQLATASRASGIMLTISMIIGMFGGLGGIAAIIGIFVTRH